MSSLPPNPEPTTIGGPYKQKIPLDANGEPVQLSGKLGPQPPKKPKTAPQKLAPVKLSTKPVPVIPAAGSSQTQARSASVEEIPDEDDIVCSATPLNP